MDSSVLARLSAALTGRYTLERELGRGGMATVWLARDLKHDRLVALKILRPELAAALGPERFLREITLTAGLDHPHILPLLDSGEAAGFLYYTMPYVAGESLRDRLSRERQLPMDDAVQIAREVADALGYAHGRGVVHRDVKPENILLAGGHARVADFGIARAIAAAVSDRLTETGIAVGTPAYMSPEQGAGSRELDGRSDLYSLGCVLYEMLGGETPYLGNTPQAILAKKLTEPAPRVSVLRETVPTAVEAALTKVLARTPADRFLTAAQFVGALRGATQARPTWRRLAGQPHVHAIAAVAALGALTLLGRGLLRGRGPGPHDVVIGRQIALTTDPGFEIDPVLSADGRFIAYTAGPLLHTQIHVRQVDGGRPVAVGDTGGPTQRWPRWSPDGQRLLYCAGRNVMVVAALGGTPRVVARATGRLWGADWSPDGRAIAFTAADSLYVVTLSDGAQRTLGGWSDLHSPTWSPMGDLIAFVSGNRAYVGENTYGNSAVSSILVTSAAGGAATAMTDGRALAVSPAWLADGQGLLFVSDRDGPRDVYTAPVGHLGKEGRPPARVTAGLRPHSITLSRDGRRLGYNQHATSANVWMLPMPAGRAASTSQATPVTRGSQVIETLTISADGRWLYYDSDRTGRPELYRIAAAGGEPEQLTDAPGGHFWPVLSPDGREVAFQSQRHGTRDLFMMPAEGGAVSVIWVAAGEDNGPQWFPDGRRIGFQHWGGDLPNGWYVTDRTGDGWSTPRRLADGPAEVTVWLAPDGHSLLLDADMNLETVSLVDGTTRPLYVVREPNDPQVRLPRYAPDGTIYFMGQVGTQRAIYAVTPGGTARQIVRFDDPYRQPIWSGFDTDGRRLFFTISEGHSDLWVADARVR